MTARTFLVRGLLAGLVAGLAAFAVAFVVGEPSLTAAIAVEESGTAGEHTHDSADTGAAHSHGAEEAEVSRTVQSTVGLLTATGVAGTTLGGLVGVISALALGRLGGLSPRASTLAVVAVGFVSLYAVPFLVYPPNPPAVGQGETIGPRTALYFTAVAISLIAGTVAVLVGRRLTARWGGWYAGLAATGGYLITVGVAAALLPRYDEVPAGFPASVLYEFRLASFGVQLTLWVVLGVLLAELVGRATRPVERQAPTGVDAAA